MTSCITYYLIGQSRIGRKSINNTSVVGRQGVKKEHNSMGKNIVYVNYKNRGVRKDGMMYRLIGGPKKKT